MTQGDLPIPTPNGFDSIIARWNPEWAPLLPVDSQLTLIGERGVAILQPASTSLPPRQLLVASIALRILVRKAIAIGGLSDHVQMAWFVLTTDPAVVKKYGEAHDCPTCRSGTDQALAQLRRHPDEPLIVGILAF